MYPGASPTSQLGQLETEIRQVKNEVGSKANVHEISSLNRKVDTLVSAVRDVSSVCDGILSRLEACEKEIQTRDE